MEKIDTKDIRVSGEGRLARIEHIPTGISATWSASHIREINFIHAFQLLTKKIENHYSYPLKKAC